MQLKTYHSIPAAVVCVERGSYECDSMASLSNARAHTEAYVGLFLLLFALTVLAFKRDAPRAQADKLQGGTSKERPERRPMGKDVTVQGILPEKEGAAVGNALIDGVFWHGLLVGNFADDKSVRHSTAVKMKWAVNQKVTTHGGLVSSWQAPTGAILSLGSKVILL